MSTKKNTEDPINDENVKPAGRGAVLEIDDTNPLPNSPVEKVDLMGLFDEVAADLPPAATVAVAESLVDSQGMTELAGGNFAPQAKENAPNAEGSGVADPAGNKVDLVVAAAPGRARSSAAKMKDPVVVEGSDQAVRVAAEYEGEERTGSEVSLFGSRPAGYEEGKKWRESSHRAVQLFDAVQAVKKLCTDNSTTVKVLSITATDKGEPMLDSGHKFTPSGLESIWSLVGLNLGTLADLRQAKHAGKYGDIVIRLLNDALRAQTQNREVLIRLRQVKLRGSEDREWRVRAVKPAHYLVFDNDAMMNVILAAFPKEWGNPMNAYTPHVSYTGDEMTGTMIPESFVSEKTDGEWGFGFNFGNSEVGGRNATTDPYTFRGLCFNGAIWRQSDLSVGRFVQRHTGLYTYEQAVNDMRAAMLESVERGQQLYGRIAESAAIKVADPKLVVVELAIAQELTVTQGRAWYQGLIETLAEFGESESQANVGHIINGLTRAAQVFEGTESTRLQELAGKMLFSDQKESVTAMGDRFDSYARRAVMNRTGTQADSYLSNAVVAPPLQAVAA